MSSRAAAETDDVLVVTLPAADAPKRAKGSWPPVPEGTCFIVEKDDAEKWSPKQHTSTVAKATFIVTLRGVRCSEPGCQNPGFAEVGVGETNHVSSLHACDKHAASFHPPPKKIAPSVLYHFKPKAPPKSDKDTGGGGGGATRTAMNTQTNAAGSSVPIHTPVFPAPGGMTTSGGGASSESDTAYTAFGAISVDGALVSTEAPATVFGATLGAKPPTAPTAAAGTFSFGGKPASAAAAAAADSAVSVGDKGTCSGSVAVALMQELMSTFATLENEVALTMADDAELDDSSGADLPLQPAAVGGAAGGGNEGVGSAVCTGFAWTGSEPFTLNYPFGIHTVQQLNKVVTWEASTSGTLRSTTPKCTGFTAEDEDGTCASCAALGSSTFLRGVIARAAEKDMHRTAMGTQYLTITQQQARHQRHVQSESKYRLMVWTGDARVSRLLRRIDTHKRLLLALSEDKLPRVHALLLAEIRHKNSPAAILVAVQEAVAGRRRATGNKDQDELDMALLAKHISPRLLYGLNKFEGVASEKSVRRYYGTIPRFISCVIDMEARIVLRNFESFIFEAPVPTNRCLWHFAIDGVASEELFRPGLNDGCLRGICPCAVRAGLSVEPSTMSDVILVQSMLDAGTVHLCSELLVGAMIPNRRDDYGPRVVLAQGICKHVNSNFNRRIIELVVRIWKKDLRGEKLRGPLSTTQSDGASVLTLAQHVLFDKPFLTSPGSDVGAAHADADYASGTGSSSGSGAAQADDDADTTPGAARVLTGLPLFPKYCGQGPNEGVADGRDGKHVGKRFKTRANTKTLGFAIASSFQYIRAYLRNIIEEAGLATEPELKEMFNEGGADAQNVPAMVKLIVALHGLKSKVPSDFPSRDQTSTMAVLRELRVLAEYAACFERLFLGKELTLEEHLNSLSTMAHLLLVLFRRNGTKFVPAQHYSNTQRMIRGHFWSVATAQVHEIDEYYLFLDSTDPLEQMFGIIRDLHGSGTQFDCVQFEERASAAMSIQAIYSRHPEWHRGARRLTGSLDHMNPRAWLL